MGKAFSVPYFSIIAVFFVIVLLFTRLAIFLKIDGILMLSDRKVTFSERLKASPEQGIHFILGIVFGFIFGTWIAGLIGGIIKELLDLIYNLEEGTETKEKIHDSVVDLSFWILGSFCWRIIPFLQYLVS